MIVPTPLNPLTTSAVIRNGGNSSSSIVTVPNHHHHPSVINGSSTTSTATKRQYKCTTCPKSFTRPSALKTHVYTHTGEKPFECTTPGCGRRFAVISNLRRHFKVHARVHYELSPSPLHHGGDIGEYPHHHHQQRIPASERLRHVQRLMERTAALQMLMDSNKNKHGLTTEDCGSLSDSSSTTSSCSSSTLPSPSSSSSSIAPPPLYFMSSSVSVAPTSALEQDEYCWDQHRFLTHRSS